MRPFFSLLFTFLVALVRESVCQCATGPGLTTYMVNGGFESPVLATGTNWQITNPGSIPGWTSLYSQIGRGPGYNPLWPSTQVCSLATMSDNIMYNQTFSLTIGSTYRLELQAAARSGQPLTTSGFIVLWNDVLLLDQSVAIDYNVHSYSVDFVVNLTVNKMTLQAVGTLDSYGTTVDNVKVREIVNYNQVLVNGTCVCANGFYPSPPNPQCQPCTAITPQCLLCQNTSTPSCTQCQWGYYLSSPFICRPCSLALPLCTNCSMNGLACYQCPAIANMNLVNGSCLCDTGYYYYAGVCQACSVLDVRCLTCLFSAGGNSCLTCLIGYYPVGATCVSCTTVHTACTNCTAGICYNCLLTGNWLHQNNTCTCPTAHYQASPTQCNPCTALDPLCLLCSNTPACLNCTIGFYPSGPACLSCNTTLSGCQECNNNGTVCTLCDTGNFWQLVNGTCICQTSYYQSSTTQCSPCTNLDPLCLLCTNASACINCTVGSYPASTSCLPCNTTLTGCLECDNTGAVCSKCDNATFWTLANGTCICQAGYYQSSPTQCSPCTNLNPLCQLCLTNSACLNCTIGYYPVGTSCLPCSTALTGCLECDINGAICTKCDNATFWALANGTCICSAGYYPASPTLCSPCTALDPLCLLCSNISVCLSCSVGYFPVGTSCLPCNTTVSGCLECDVSGTVCTRCDNASFWMLVNGTCSCQPAYYLAGPALCSPCTNLDPLCQLCSNTPACLTCTVGFFPLATACPSCNTTLPGCLICDNAGAVCILCDNVTFWQLSNGTCSCQPGYYLALPTRCDPCSALDTHCILCSENSGTPVCLTCTIGYYPSGSACLPCNTTLMGCLECNNNGTVCTLCDNATFWQLSNGTCACQASYYLNTTSSICLSCSVLDPLCLLCGSNSSSYQCHKCAWGSFPIGPACTPCSTVLVSCLNCSMDGQVCFACNESLDYFLDSYTSANVSQVCTRCALPQCLDCLSLWVCGLCDSANNYYLNASTGLCEACTLEGCLNCSTLQTCYECDAVANYLLNNVTSQCHVCTLEGCIRCSSNQTCQVCGEGYKTMPNSNFQCDKKTQGCSALEKSFSASTTSPAVPQIDYSLQQCQNAQKFKVLAQAVGYTSYVLLFMSIFSGKIVGLELFGVLQLAYFNLADQEFVNLYLSPILNWRFLNGFNFYPSTLAKNSADGRRRLSSVQISGTSMYTTSSDVVPPNVKAIGYTHSFIENMNIMMIILVAEFFLALLVLILSFKVIRCLKKIGFILLKQVFITLLIFNCFNIAFSAGLHYKYATPQNTDNYALSTTAAVLSIFFCLFSVIGLQIWDQSGYGEYKSKFKQSCVTRAYMTISILYRMALGFYMALGNEQEYQSLFILAISFVYVLYNIINLPFQSALQNYRANLCHSTQLLILFVSNFYTGMKANEPMNVKGLIFTPAKLQIVMIVMCLVISAACLIYELGLIIYRRCTDAKIKSNEERLAEKSDKSQAHMYTTEGNEELYEEKP